MSYFVQSDLKPYLPDEWALQALDDNSDGTEDSFSAVQSAADGAVDDTLHPQYAVPIASPENFPILKRAAVLEAARLCYTRRGYDEDKWPHRKAWDRVWSRLDKIGAGELQLGPAAEGNESRARPRGSVITGPARTYNTSGGFAA